MELRLALTAFCFYVLIECEKLEFWNYIPVGDIIDNDRLMHIIWVISFKTHIVEGEAFSSTLQAPSLCYLYLHNMCIDS